jgi:hypothetical protein
MAEGKSRNWKYERTSRRTQPIEELAHNSAWTYVWEEGENVMRSVWLVLTVVVLCALPVLAETPSHKADATAAEAHFSKGEGDVGPHVHVTLKRPDVAELNVEVLTAEGASIASYQVDPLQGGHFRSELTIRFPADVAAKADHVRISGFTLRSNGTREQLFNIGSLGATRMSCTGMCSPTRIECNNNCAAMSCTSATYSCTDTGAGCEATCICNGCP